MFELADMVIGDLEVMAEIEVAVRLVCVALVLNFMLNLMEIMAGGKKGGKSLGN